ncbi:MAG: acyl-ACP--UDP-N-acetylglucosamine O-acyltransferase [Planctomycetota bacterium]|nr:acyl-ACP--UDP-N-acetylglucosamine O-acyltransferase [Planctomycetota bacterium]
MATNIHPTAVVAPGAQLGTDVEIGPHCVISKNAIIGDRTRLGPQVVINGHTTLGKENVIHGLASLGGAPQDFSYRGEETRLEIGARNTVREFVTINRGTIKGGGVTRIADDCLLMACCHVAHDCEIESGVILSNNVLLAGHVRVCERANISGSSAAQHFVTIGKFAYVGGLTRMAQDVPPYMILEGHPSRVRGVNVIGLRRGEIAEDEISILRDAYKAIWRSEGLRREIFVELEQRHPNSPSLAQLLSDMRETEAGGKGRYRESMREDFMRMGRELILGEK